LRIFPHFHPDIAILWLDMSPFDSLQRATNGVAARALLQENSMTHSNTIDRPAVAGQETAPAVTAVVITIDDVAKLLGCSTRHVRRMADSGRIPRPVKFGALLRWIKADIDQWILAGCPNSRKGAR
jgi:excisionase family DNA binding protein